MGINLSKNHMNKVYLCLPINILIDGVQLPSIVSDLQSSKKPLRPHIETNILVLIKVNKWIFFKKVL